MRLIERNFVAAPPTALWPWLADPARWPQWNRKMKDVRRNGTGDLKHGEAFSVVATLSRSQEMQAEVIRVEPGRRLVLRCRYEWRRRWRGVTEDWQLTAQDGGTLVRHVTNLKDSGIPMPVQLLLWSIQRFGRPMGGSPWAALERQLKAEREKPKN